MKTMNVHGRFFGLLARLPYQSKREIVWQYSNMLTDSLSEFYEKDPQGYDHMIRDMQKMIKSMDNTPKSQGDDRDIKKLRSAILHRLQKHGVDTTNWNKVNSFMENPRIAGKRLYDMTGEEMKLFIPKLESILKKDEKQQTEINRLTQLN